MGVKNLMKFIQLFAPSAITSNKIANYSDKRIGIDANLLLYKLIYAIRANGYDITNTVDIKLMKPKEIIVTHIHALLLKLLAFKRFDIIPVFVFDSVAPAIKFETLDERRKVKQKLINKYKNSKTDKGKRIYYYVKSDISDIEIQQCRSLIQIFGYMIVDAKEEADAQLAELYKSRLIDYVASDDTDMLLFGCGRLLKNFTVAEYKQMQEISLETLLSECEITMDQLIDIGILLGTDYCSIKNYSPAKAFDMIKKYKTITRVPTIKHTCDSAVSYYKNAPVNKIKSVTVGKFNPDKLYEYLRQFYFKEKYVTRIADCVANKFCF